MPSYEIQNHKDVFAQVNEARGQSKVIIKKKQYKIWTAFFCRSVFNIAKEERWCSHIERQGKPQTVVRLSDTFYSEMENRFHCVCVTGSDYSCRCMENEIVWIFSMIRVHLLKIMFFFHYTLIHLRRAYIHARTHTHTHTYKPCTYPYLYLIYNLSARLT